MRHLLPDCVFTDDGFVAGLGVTIDDGGLVVDLSSTPAADVPIKRLDGKALMPGFVNSHSHVFQRLLRGVAERASHDQSFWSWRKTMYSLVDRLTPDDIEAIARYTFAEMLRAGYTSVKEFHYLHHPPGGGRYDNPHETAIRLESAARSCGISLHLLRVAYLNVTEESQRRFADAEVGDAIELTASLAEQLESSVGIAPHSIRAVAPQDVARCAAWARSNQAECHAHVAEQPKEIEWSLATYGAPPMALLAEHGILSDGFTAVHATHLTADEVAVAGQAAITVCICPTTEANLGDGAPVTAQLLEAGARLAIGTDSQAEIDPFQELRLLEYNERNRLGRRQVLDPQALLTATTEALAVGETARLLELNLNHLSLVGSNTERLSSTLVMAARPECIDAVWIGAERQCREPDVALIRDLAERLL
jgi:formimidoylglutamate deiminase